MTLLVLGDGVVAVLGEKLLTRQAVQRAQAEPQLFAGEVGAIAVLVQAQTGGGSSVG